MSIGYSIGQPVKAPGNFDVDGELAVHDDASIEGSLGVAGSLGVGEDLEVWGPFLRHKTAYTWVNADVTLQDTQAGRTYIVTGGTGVTFTLPNPWPGLVFDFVNVVNQDMVVDAGLYRIIAHGEISATSIEFSSTPKIGASCRAIATADAWIVTNTSDLAMTVNT